MIRGAKRGEVLLDVEGEQVTIRFTWAAIDRVSTKWGGDWQDRVNSLAFTRSLADLADLLEAGTGRPAEWWFEKSPPINEATAAVLDAVSYAFAGPGGPDPEGPPRAGWRARLLAVLSKWRMTPGST